MRLVFATKDLAVAGRSFEGFPLLVGADGWPVEPAQSFLWHTLVESGEALSALTWEAYGRRLFDYFAFLEANGLAWNEESQADGLSVLSRYRDWSSGELELDPSTLNKRLNLIVRFYQWAKQRDLIAALPFGERRVRATPHSGFLSHVARPNAESTNDLLPDFSTTPNLVESVFRAGDGSEKAFYRRADSRLPQAGGGR
ncbi:site-specific integrase, partial [Pseudomonas aeruginosa]|uniref:site-specific integrase n=1 Tax=Pseudomonas aeruginosa TaxID=287 RepID=UPI001D0A67EB